ncbi:MAG: aldehyde dehydrogenase family protein [Motilibacteraceae bacterium]
MSLTTDAPSSRPTLVPSAPGAASPGGTVDTVDRGTIELLNPATGQPLASVPVATSEEVRRAVEAARAAAPGWARTPAGERAAALRRAAAGVRERADEIARATVQEMGRPLALALGGIEAAASTLEQYAELGPVHRGRSLRGGWDALDLMVPEPHGVVAVVTPWNDPSAVAAGLIGAALVTGNTVVHKPSERAPLCGALLAEIIAAELPQDALVLLQGGASTGRALVADPGIDLVAHVGATATGRSIAAAVAARGAQAVLENGGKDPFIVDAGVDPVWAAQQCALGAFINSGQLCTAVERIYVHRDVADAFLDALVAEAESLVMGDGLEPDTTMGPLVDRRMRDHVAAQVDSAVAAGARVLTGGSVPEGPAAFYPPTVLSDVTSDMAVMVEETFGPVAPVRVVDSFDQALREAAEGPYGLAATVMTPDLAHAQRAVRELPVGTVKVNAVFGGAPGGAAQPRGASGQGFGYGPELLDEMTLTKVVHLGIPTV